MEITTVVLSAVSAVLGAALTAFFAYRFEIQKSKFEKQRDAYFEFIVALQSVMNNDKDSTKKLLDSRNKVMVYGSEETLRYVDNYIIEVIGESQKKGILPTKEIHENSQTKIIKAMRKDLKLSSSGLDKIILIRYDNNPQANRGISR